MANNMRIPKYGWSHDDIKSKFSHLSEDTLDSIFIKSLTMPNTHANKKKKAKIDPKDFSKEEKIDKMIRSLELFGIPSILQNFKRYSEVTPNNPIQNREDWLAFLMCLKDNDIYKLTSQISYNAYSEEREYQILSIAEEPVLAGMGALLDKLGVTLLRQMCKEFEIGAKGNVRELTDALLTHIFNLGPVNDLNAKLE